MQGHSIATTADLPKLVGYKQLRDEYGWPKRTVQEWIKARKFPKPLNLPGRGNYWALDDIVAWMKGDLARVAVTRPDDLEPDQLEDAAVALVVKSMERRTGQPIDATDLGIHVTRRLTSDEFQDAERREFANYSERFSDFDVRRACVFAAWLFRCLRPIIEKSVLARDKPMHQDPATLQHFGGAALHDASWEELIAVYDQRLNRLDA